MSLFSRCRGGILLVAAFGLATLGLCASSSSAGDWPQILGPNRDGAAEKETLASVWPAGGPKALWKHDVGSGFAGVAVAGGKCVVFHRVDGKERVEALDASSGETLWKADFPTTYQPAFVDDDGPRAVPVIHNGKVYAYGAMGGLRCLNLADGKTVWSRETFQEFNSGKARGEPAEGYFGCGSSPIVEGGQVVVNIGGDEKTAGVVAFDIATGKTVWTASAERASYSSPIAVTVGKTRHLIVAARLKTLSLDPKNGAVRWSVPFGKRGPTVNGSCPTVVDGHLFLTASYGIGATLAKINDDAAETIWESDDLCSSQYTTCVTHGNDLIGVHGRQDVGDSELRCFDPRTQKVHWSKGGLGYVTLIKTDDKLLIASAKGQLRLAALDKAKYRELAQADLLPGTTRALPALSDGRFFTRNERTLACFDLAAKR